MVVTVLLHALLLLVVYIIQGMIFPYLKIYRLVPLLLPVAGTGVAVYEGRYIGGITGIFAGILCDVSLNQPAAMFTVLLTITGILVGALTDFVLIRGFPTFFICSAAVLALAAFAQMFTLLFFEGVPLQSLMPTAIWQTVYSIIFTIPLWFFVRALGKRTEKA